MLTVSRRSGVLTSCPSISITAIDPPYRRDHFTLSQSWFQIWRRSRAWFSLSLSSGSMSDTSSMPERVMSCATRSTAMPAIQLERYTASICTRFRLMRSKV
ncbi:hypothetical protein D9M70_507910 [compost metagenome]